MPHTFGQTEMRQGKSAGIPLHKSPFAKFGAILHLLSNESQSQNMF